MADQRQGAAVWERVRIETSSGTVLRPFVEDDVDAIYRACQDPLIEMFTSIPVPYERHHAEQFVRDHANNFRGWFAIASAEDDRLRGLVALVDYNSRYDEGELGYWISPEYRGLASSVEAPLALLYWALDIAKIRRVIGVADVRNAASLSLATKVGLTFEGYARGKLVDRAGRSGDAFIGSVISTSDLRDLEYTVHPVV